QPPNEQVWPAEHTRPHPPQLAASVSVSVQLSPQSVVPPVQVGWQELLWQLVPAPQALKQNPQFELSLRVSTQSPSQSVRGEAHWAMHSPSWHVEPVAHVLKQNPQFELSVAVLVHTSPHCVKGSVQVSIGAHSPKSQNALEPQSLKHSPQCRVSLCVSTHDSPHSAKGALQVGPTGSPPSSRSMTIPPSVSGSTGRPESRRVKPRESPQALRRRGRTAKSVMVRMAPLVTRPLRLFSPPPSERLRDRVPRARALGGAGCYMERVPDLVVTERVTIPDADLSWTAVRGSGPGGQNVNKVASKVDLRFDLEGTQALSADVKRRLTALASGRLDAEGRILITSQLTRDQGRNLED
ncbi:hypothetical protein GPROT1_03438, partial [Gammaproteobacteria bacterium]